MAAYTLVSSGCLLFNPSGRTQLVAIASTLPMDNNVKAKCTFRGKPSLRPSLMDHAKMLPTTTGDTALKVKIHVAIKTNHPQPLAQTDSWQTIQPLVTTTLYICTCSYKLSILSQFLLHIIDNIEFREAA